MSFLLLGIIGLFLIVLLCIDWGILGWFVLGGFIVGVGLFSVLVLVWVLCICECYGVLLYFG